MNLPAVFVCENNQYGMATHADFANAEPIELRGPAYGIPSASIDGNDIFEVYATAKKAVDPRPSRRRPNPHRVPHLPPQGPHRSGPEELPHQGGNRRVGRARPHRALPQDRQRGGAARRG